MGLGLGCPVSLRLLRPWFASAFLGVLASIKDGWESTPGLAAQVCEFVEAETEVRAGTSWMPDAQVFFSFQTKALRKNDIGGK
jgi:hypothetical protein